MKLKLALIITTIIIIIIAFIKWSTDPTYIEGIDVMEVMEHSEIKI